MSFSTASLGIASGASMKSTGLSFHRRWRTKPFAVLSILVPIPIAIAIVFAGQKSERIQFLVAAVVAVVLPPVTSLGFAIASLVRKERSMGLAIFGVFLSLLPLLCAYYVLTNLKIGF